MTPQERAKPDLLKASRKKRIAAGAGVGVPEVNRLLKMHIQMADMMKRAGKGKGLPGMPGGRMPPVWQAEWALAWAVWEAWWWPRGRCR